MVTGCPAPPCHQAAVAVRSVDMNASSLERLPTEPGESFWLLIRPKDQLCRVEARLPLATEPTRPRDVRTVLHAGAKCLFLCAIAS